MENFVWVVFCVLGVPLGLGVLIGWLIWGRKGRAANAAIHREMTHTAWLANELEGEHLRGILTVEQRDRIREHFRLLDAKQLAAPAQVE